MNNELFRKESVERISSPEQLNEYIRVTNPGVWMMTCAVLILLLGICTWGIFGRLETTITVGGITEGGVTTCYVKETYFFSVHEGMAVHTAEETYEIAYVMPAAVSVDESFPAYLVYVGELAEGEWVYPITLNRPCGEDGSVFAAQIIVESVAPIHFLWN